MTLRDAMRASAARFLAPGETIQSVFFGRTTSPLGLRTLDRFGLIGALLLVSFNEYRIVAVTDQRILVLDSGKRSAKNALGVVDVLPRATRLGPGKSLFYTIEVPSGRIIVHRRFFKDIEAADAAIAASAASGSR